MIRYKEVKPSASESLYGISGVSLLPSPREEQLTEQHHGINPNSPHNFASIDKRIPINQVRFVSELKRHGEPTHNLPPGSGAI